MQSDGNLVLYVSEHFGTKNLLWSSGTAGKGTAGRKLELGVDGNLVVRSGNDILWSSNTSKHGAGGYYLLLQNDANLVLYDINRKGIWASNTVRV